MEQSFEFFTHTGDAGRRGAVMRTVETGVPRPIVVPTISSTAVGYFVLGDEGAGSANIHGVRITLNAATAAAAAGRLVDATADVIPLGTNVTRNITSAANITRVDIVAIGNIENTTSGLIIPDTNAAGAGANLWGTATSEANVQSAMVSLEFDAASEVRTLVLSISSVFAGATANDNFVGVHVYGLSHVATA